MKIEPTGGLLRKLRMWELLQSFPSKIDIVGPYSNNESHLFYWPPYRKQVKWNESGFRPPLCTYRLNWARRTSWGWWDDWDDTVLQTQDFREIRALAVWGRARYLSVTEAPHNTDFHKWMGKKHFCFFETAETGNRTPNSGVKGNGANHYPRAPAHRKQVG